MNEDFETDLYVFVTSFDGLTKEYFMTFEEYEIMCENWDQEGVKKLIVEVLENSNAEG